MSFGCKPRTVDRYGYLDRMRLRTSLRWLLLVVTLGYLGLICLATLRSSMGFGYFEHPSYFNRRPVTLIPFKASLDAIDVGNSHRVITDAFQNVIVFIPLGGAFILMLGRRWKWWIIGGLAAFSAFIEVFQYVAIIDRRASVDDFMLNVFGGAIGVCVGLWLLGTLPAALTEKS